MKDSGCWLDGNFFYTPLYFEVYGIRKEVEDMSDFDLVDEVAYLCEDVDEIDDILYNYIKGPGNILSDEDREKLIWFYTICHIEDYLVISEDGEEW